MDLQEEKLKILADFTYSFFKKQIKKDNFINSVCIDGGECTGTTSLSKGVIKELQKKYINCEWTREPSQKCKEKFINQMTYDNSLVSPGEKVESIIDIFMKDRQECQSYIKSNPSVTFICDRSVLSTIIYQSGILDKKSTIEELKRNCSLIEKYNEQYSIKLPKILIVLSSLTKNSIKFDIEEFNRRLKIRQESGDVDGMDTIERYLLVNDAYSYIVQNSLMKLTDINNIEDNFFFPMDFKYHSIDKKVDFIIDIISNHK